MTGLRTINPERAINAVRATAEGMTARAVEPRGFECRRRWETIVLALVTVPRRETPLAYWASTDGDDAKAVAIPKSVVRVVDTAAGGLFLLATMKAWVAIDRHLAQANVPGLIRSRQLTDDERAGWKRLQRQITVVRRELADAAKPLHRRRKLGMDTFVVRSRNDVA
jgi:hypothetical protein